MVAAGTEVGIDNVPNDSTVGASTTLPGSITSTGLTIGASTDRALFSFSLLFKQAQDGRLRC